MSLETFIKNTGAKISKKVEQVAQDRARRLNDPAFQAELMKSRNELVKHLSNTGSNILDSAYKVLLRGPGVTAWLVAKSIVDKKTRFSDHALPKILDEIASTGSSIGKTLYYGMKTAGRGSVHTLRWLFAK